MADDIRTLHLTKRELGLLLKYGYLDPDDAAMLRSAQKIRRLSPLEERDALCDVLETAEQNNARARGVPLE